MDNELIPILIGGAILLVLALILVALIFETIATWLIVYVEYVLRLPWIIVIPVFVIFPPAFFAFLVGLFFAFTGDVNANGEWRPNWWIKRFNKPSARKQRKIDEKWRKKRRELGYEDEPED